MDDQEEQPSGGEIAEVDSPVESAQATTETSEKPKPKRKTTKRKTRKSTRRKSTKTKAKTKTDEIKDRLDEQVCGDGELPPQPSGAGIRKELALGGIIVFVVALGLIYMMGQEDKNINVIGESTTTLPGAAAGVNYNVADSDDIVTVEYTGLFINGTVFDSSIEEVAKENGVYNPLRTYEPITFTLGYGGIIAGFEEAVLGMKVGGEKEITLPPEKSYGQPREELIQVVEREQKSPIVQNVSISKFLEDIGEQPYVGMMFNLGNRTDYEITWPMSVEEVYNDTVRIRYHPTENATINTVFGQAMVYGAEDDIIIKINPYAGQKLVTLAGPARVISVNNDNVTLDFNHELAGKTLKFKLKLVGVVKQ